MSTAEARKELPGLDSAPDVYATPDFNDDATESTNDTSPERGSESDTSHEDEEDDTSYGVSRRRLYPDRARSRFDAQSRGVETSVGDMSDRVDGKRKGLKVRRLRRDEVEQEPETLEAKIARLKREMEECRLEAQAEDEAAQKQGEAESGIQDAIESLSRMMSGLDMPASKRRGHARNKSAYHDAPSIPPSTTEQQQNDHQQSPPGDQTLSNVTAFDSRLAAIESALGLSSLDAATEMSALSSPLLPTIALLDHQVATLTSATSLSALEAASTRIHKLKAEAAELSDLQTQPPQSTATSDAEDSASEAEVTSPPAALTSEDMQSLQALYAILPTLQSLSPMVPALTNRLRSLRTIHTAAANAHNDLDELEGRQVEMDKELKMWREGLEKVEEAVETAGEQNANNGKFVKQWIEELDGRVKALRR
ncbi:uncharacterized protein RCC_05047 [Ramularia collo-cygni]|uniref:Dynactin subunit n=1 Tax=Ramularia collo-cygni TaxID=112498 RepID=A0A2D3USG1_9PEZI|nr:uncharacterized protein RCC_05047 [Ramularia collo-cygni]CZT19201.1 uncharacterized protein RCC_05047 [Ramularia collo-cygni]